MATLGEVKTRIIEELDRDDMASGEPLEARLVNAIERSIAQYENERFWFNWESGTASTTGGVSTVAMPAGVRSAKIVAHDGCELERTPLDQIVSRTETGRPRKWAENEGAIQLWPIPDGAYTLDVYGIADVGVPDTDGDSNIWTTEAEDLIVGAAKKRLCRGPLRDTEGALLAQGEEAEALSVLRRETRQRGAAKLTTDAPRPRWFNLLAGW